MRQSIDWICAALALAPAIEFSGGDRGWSGDSPFIQLDCSRIRALGWRPSLPLRESVLRTLSWLQSHPQELDLRAVEIPCAPQMSSRDARTRTTLRHRDRRQPGTGV